MGLNTDPIMCRYFSTHTTVRHDPQLVEPMDAKPQIQRAKCKVICGFSTVQRVGAPNPHVVQGSTVFSSEIAFKSNLQVISENASIFSSKQYYSVDLSFLIYHSHQMTYNSFQVLSTFKKQSFFHHWR